MPIVHIKINDKIPSEKRERFFEDIANAVSVILEKPKADVQILYSYFDIWMNGNDKPAAFIDIKFVSGLNNEKAFTLCTKLGNILQSVVAVDLSRININFVAVQTVHAWRFKNGVAECPPKHNNNL